MDPTAEPLTLTARIQDYFQSHFGLIQIGISALFILLWMIKRSQESSKSGFKLREADRGLKFERGTENARRSGEATARPKPAQLTGIVADGAPHEVLGISAMATEAEIQKAFKERIKRYHPDLIGRPGSPEWQEATKIAEAINRARNEMLERLRRR